MAKKLQKSDMFSPIFNRLIDLCENNNTTVTTLLDKFTNSRSAINAWKNGNINTELLPKIANDLNISLEFLLTGKEAQINNLSDNEQEMLDVFSKFNEREQIKLIGKLEELYRQKQIKESQQPAALKVSRSPDRKFRRTEISKEELEKNTGYTSTSLIGKTGLEKQFENRLKGKSGVEIYIEDKDGNRKETLIKQEKEDGEDIKLTIDSTIQNNLYNELKDDEGLFVVMNPKTGEILALVSTPSYDSNDFVLGLTNDEWNALNNDENKPLYNRFLQSYCPGSTFKPITAAIGLSSGKLSKDDTFNYSGLSWQKDASWGTYNITTLTAYSGAKNLKNALIHSDNIYFAQAALKIGNKNMEENLNKIKFNENIDFALNLSKSQYSNNQKLDKETMLADTGYGQGQILVNPIHMASIYSGFYNEGNMVKPYLEYNKDTSYLVENAFSKEAAEEIKNDLIQVVENPEGTAKDMKVNGVSIAGKDETADTIGWFDCFTVNEDNPYLVVGMVEKANTNGGSHYLIPKIKKLFIK